MDQPLLTLLASYWSAARLEANLLIALNLGGSLLLGLLVGYERAYHGRAAGMRTYGLVCMASCAITVVAGYPEQWFGGAMALHTWPDPTRVIQGIVTGVGFIGAGVIMKEGLSISGLTTAASIWSASAIGILVGVGFYLAALLLAALAGSLMMWAYRLECLLPARPALAVTLRFAAGVEPGLDALRQLFRDCGYQLAEGSVSVHEAGAEAQWRCVVVSQGRGRAVELAALAQRLRHCRELAGFELAHARN